jgi:hypothetical protein
MHLVSNNNVLTMQQSIPKTGLILPSMISSNDENIEIITILAKVLERLIEVNSNNFNNQQDFIAKFQCSYAPDVSILAYLERIRKYANCSDCCFIVALIYIDRIIEKRNVILTQLNIHRLLLTCVLLAAKFFDDLFYNNAFYAKLGGITTNELNSLEIEMLKLINFSLSVNRDSYDHYCYELQRFANTLNANKLMLNTICDDEENQVLQSPVSVTHSTNEAMGGVRPVKLNDYWSNAVPNIIAGFVSC